MGHLRRVEGGEALLLTQRCLLGRSRACTIRLDDPDVSGEHALLRWTGGAWEVQDLHSRNGTFVDRMRLAAGERAALTADTVLGFGRPETFALVDADAPTPFATPVAGGPPIAALAGLLALPGPTAPELMVFRGARGWVVERSGEIATVADGDVLRVGDEAWRLHLPEPLPQTAEPVTRPLHLDDLTLRFRVSRDEEYVELTAVHDAQAIDLKARAHHYTLLVLARARLRDAALPADVQGWVHQSELLDQLRVDVNHLNLSIYRMRQQLGEAGVSAAARIVERRAGTRQVRVGTARIEILTLERSR